MFSLRYVSLSACLLLALTCVAADFGLISIPIAPLREKPGHAAEMGTQALLGTPVRLHEVVDGNWWLLTLPDGYRGYIHVNSVQPLSEQQARMWRDSQRMMSVTAAAPLTDAASGLPAGFAPYGAVLELAESLPGGRLRLLHPTGVEVLAEEADFTALDVVAARRPDAETTEQAIARGIQMLGAPYLWGGTTMMGLDCSGFTQLCWREGGALLPRNASQQANIGIEVPSLAEAGRGDLVLFAALSGRIDHVAIYLGNGEILHSSGRVWRGTLLDREDSDLPRFDRLPAKIMRLTGADSIPMLIDNELYYNK